MVGYFLDPGCFKHHVEIYLARQTPLDGNYIIINGKRALLVGKRRGPLRCYHTAKEHPDGIIRFYPDDYIGV